jgi:hypothetical protein
LGLKLSGTRQHLAYVDDVNLLGDNMGTVKEKKNSVARVYERTIQTERRPLLGEASANPCGQRVPRGQHDVSLRPYSRFSRPEQKL